MPLERMRPFMMQPPIATRRVIMCGIIFSVCFGSRLAAGPSFSRSTPKDNSCKIVLNPQVKFHASYSAEGCSPTAGQAEMTSLTLPPAFGESYEENKSVKASTSDS
jgi:hypothetical protein